MPLEAAKPHRRTGNTLSCPPFLFLSLLSKSPLAAFASTTVAVPEFRGDIHALLDHFYNSTDSTHVTACCVLARRSL